MNTKLLRQQILDLAIRGKLVKQDPNDEPASVLLERIRAEKEQLIQQGKIKKPKTYAPTDTPDCENIPFDIPDSWEWVRVSDIAKTITGGTPSKNKPQYYGGTFPFYKPADLDAGRNVIVASEYLSEEGKSISRVIPPNSIAICCIGSIGKCGYLTKECTTNQQINTIVPYTNIFPLLIYHYCCSSFFKQQLVEKSSAITISIVNKSKLEDTLLPLPPLAEQQRIVAEIEKWFALIDELEANKQDLQGAIKQVRAKVLDLAIHGKFVPQDPTDEPAIDLLRRINPHYTPSDTSHYENIPQGWEVCRLEDIVEVLDNKRKPIRAEERAKRIDGKKDLYPYYGATGFVGYIDEYLLEGQFILLGEDGAPFLDRYATKAYAVNGKIWVNNHAHILLPKIDFEYMLHYLNAVDYSLYAKGTTRLKLTQGDMSNILVLLPPLEEQKCISKQIANIFSILQAISAEL